MKKSVIAFVVLFVLTIPVAIGCGIAVYAPREALEVEERIHYGEQSAAHGITVDVKTTVEDHLFWDTNISVGGEIKHDYTFYNEKPFDVPPPYNEQYLGVEVYYNLVGSTDWDENRNSVAIMLEEAVKDIASHAPTPTKNYRKTIPLADYVEYMPYYIYEYAFEGYHFTRESAQEVTDYFKIPTPDNFMIEVSISKNEMGEIFHSSCRENNAHDGHSTFHLLEIGDCVFAIPWRIAEVPADMQGVHHFTLTSGKKENQVLVEGQTARGYDIEDTMSIPKMVYPYVDGTEVVEFVPSADEKSLLMVTRKDNMLTLVVLDAETGAYVDSQKISEPSQKYVAFDMEVREDFLVFFFEDGTVQVVTWENGDYQIAMTVCLTDYPQIPLLNGDSCLVEAISQRTPIALDYDGSRLAIAVINETNEGIPVARLLVIEDGTLTFVVDYEIDNPAEYGGIRRRLLRDRRISPKTEMHEGVKRYANDPIGVSIAS